jgi:hypothetical protein
MINALKPIDKAENLISPTKIPEPRSTLMRGSGIKSLRKGSDNFTLKLLPRVESKTIMNQKSFRKNAGKSIDGDDSSVNKREELSFLDKNDNSEDLLGVKSASNNFNLDFNLSDSHVS